MSTSLELAGAGIDREAILKALNLNPRDPKTQALLLVCERYQLDPLLKHMVLISGNPYITRDGYLAVAHRSGKFDGLEVLDEGADQTHWWAKVAVWRKDMSHPFTYVGRYPKNGHQKTYGPEMAIKCAEVMGLRRAFNVTGVGAADEAWDQAEPVAVDNRGAEAAVTQEVRDANPRPTPPEGVDPETGEIQPERSRRAVGPPIKKPTIVEAAQQVKSVDPVGAEKFDQLKARKQALDAWSQEDLQAKLTEAGLLGFTKDSSKADAAKVEALIAEAEKATTPKDAA